MPVPADPDEPAGPNAYQVYGERRRPQAPRADAATPHPHAAVCPGCDRARFEDGFVESAAEGKVRWFAGKREEGFFGVRRFGLEKRVVIARRCLTCSRLDLYAGDVTVSASTALRFVLARGRHGSDGPAPAASAGDAARRGRGLGQDDRASDDRLVVAVPRWTLPLTSSRSSAIDTRREAGPADE